MLSELESHNMMNDDDHNSFMAALDRAIQSEFDEPDNLLDELENCHDLLVA